MSRLGESDREQANGKAPTNNNLKWLLSSLLNFDTKDTTNQNAAFYNAAFGEEALHNNFTGLQNVAIGNSALANNLTVNDLTATGYLALNQDLVSENTAIGSWSMHENVSGVSNVAMGNGALQNNRLGKCGHWKRNPAVK